MLAMWLAPWAPYLDLPVPGQAVKTFLQVAAESEAQVADTSLPMLCGLGYRRQRQMSLIVFSLWSQGLQAVWSHTVCLSNSLRSTRKSCSRLEADQTEVFGIPRLLTRHPELLKGSEVLQPRSACWLVGKLCSKVQKLREGYDFHTL